MQESGDLGLIRRGSGKGILSEIQPPGKGILGGRKGIPSSRWGSVRFVVSDCGGRTAVRIL